MAGEMRDATVAELQREGVLFVEDGNHGEYRPLADEFVKDGMPFIRPDDLKAGRVDFKDCDRINEVAVQRVRKGKGHAGDIVFTHRATVGRIARIGPSDPDFVANPGVTIWRSNDPNIIDPTYLYFFMQTPTFMNQVWAEAGNTDTFPYVSLTQQRRLSIHYPAIGQQRAVAHVLGTLDDKIELNRRMNETLEAIARALFKSWFVDFDPVHAKANGLRPLLNGRLGELFPDSFLDTEGAQIPRGWRYAPLSEFCEINPQRVLRKGENAPYIDMGSIPTRGHSPVQWFDRPYGSGSRFENGDTLLARITPCLENGKTAYIDILRDGEVGWGSTEYIVMRPIAPLPNEYAYCLARSEPFRDVAIRSMTGSSGRQRVSVDAIANFRIAMPSEPIARAFGEIVAPLFARAKEAAGQSRILAEMRDDLLPKLISGDIRVSRS